MLFCLACVSSFASAQALPIEAGEYYFKTTYGSQEYFLGGANNWGTRAALIPNSVAWNLEAVGTNVYRLDSYQSNGGDSHYLGSNAYVDAGAVDVYFTQQSDGSYTLSLGSSDQYLQVEAMGCHNLPALNWAGDVSSALKWQVVSIGAEIKKYDNITYLLRDANFDTNNRWGGWVSTTGDNQLKDKTPAWTMEASNRNLRGGEQPNTCAESWHSAFTLSQVIEDVPNGFYTMTCQAAIRVDGGGAYDGVDYAFAYINDAKADFIAMENKDYVDYTIYRWGADAYTHSFNPSVENSANMYDFSQLFAEGQYKLSVPVLVTDGKITVGAKGTRTDTWCIFDNFGLKFMGDDESDFPAAEQEDALEAYLTMLYDEADAAYTTIKTTLAGYSTFAQNQVASDLTTLDGNLAAIKTSIEGGSLVANKTTILAAIEQFSTDIEAVIPKADPYDAEYKDVKKAYDDVVTALNNAKTTIAGYDAYVQNEMAADIATVEGDLSDVNDDIEDQYITLTVTPTDAAAIKAALVDVKDDVDALLTTATTMDGNYKDFMDDVAAIGDEWRDANKDIAELDKKYDGEIMVGECLDKINEANKLIKEVKDEIEDGVFVLADEMAKIAAAKAAIAAAKAAAEQNVKEFLALPAGEYYLMTEYDSKTYFLGGANNWGTRAALIPNSVLWNLEKVSAGVYKLDSYQSNGGDNHYLGSNAYVDAGAADIYFTEQGEGTGIYTLSLAAADNYLKFAEMGCHNLPALAWGGAAGDALKFKVVSANAEIKKYDDVTYLIRNANFDTNNRWGGHRDHDQAWTMEAANQNLRGGEAPNTCAESWHSAFTLSQTIEGLPNGYYTMTVQAAVRDDSEAAQAAYAAGAESFGVADAPVAYINEATAPFIEMENKVISGYQVYRWNAEVYTAGDFNNAINGSGNMWNFSQLFAEGKYRLTVPVEVTDGKITLGVKGTRTDTWCIFDNFTLKYMGDDATDVNEIPYAELIAAYDAAKAAFDDAKTDIAALDEFVGKNVDADVKKIDKDLTDVKTAIEKAHTDIKCSEQKESLLATIDGINEAIAALADKAQTLQDDNDDSFATIDAAYAALVQNWQDAYDKINTEYKEYFNTDDDIYNGYLKQLSSSYLDIDALDATIKSMKIAGTCKANEEKILKQIADLSAAVDLTLDTALNNYNDEICGKNQAEYKKVTDRCDEITKAYKEAIVKISEHYAEYHAETAAKAQVDLFDIYTNVQEIKSDAAEDYANIESTNKTKFEAENLPLTSFFSTFYIAALEFFGQDQIDDILVLAEANAAAENDAMSADFAKAINAQKTAVADAEALIATYGLNADDYADDVKSIYAHLNNAKGFIYPVVDMKFSRRVSGDNPAAFGNGVIYTWGIYGANAADAPADQWEKLATIDTPEDAPIEWTKQFVPEGYQYLRFYFEKNKANSIFGHLSEFQLLLNGQKLITDASQLVSPCGDSAEGTHIEYLLDENTATMWHSDWHGAYTAGAHYIQVNLTAPVPTLTHAYVPATEDAEAYWVCSVMDADAIQAEIDAAKDEIAALNAKLKGDKSEDLLAAIVKKAGEATEALEAAIDDKYEDAVKEMFAEQEAAIQKAIDDVVTEATAADEAGTLLTMYAALDAKLGEVSDVYADQNIIAVTMAKGTGSSYDDNTVNGKFSIKVGTSTKTGSANIVVPAGVKTVTFKAVAWKGQADLTLNITDGSADPAKTFTIHGNDGLSGNSPYTIDETDEMIVKYEFAAKTTAEVTLDIAADKRFIIWDAQGTDGAAAVNSQYAEINHLAAEALNENCKVLDDAAIATLKANLAEAKTIIAGLGQDKATEIAVITGEISAVQTKVKNYYEAKSLAANDAEIQNDIEVAQDDIDGLLSDSYREDLEAKISDVKTTWNLEYAKLETTGQLTADQKELFDEIYEAITIVDNAVTADPEINGEEYEEYDDAIANLDLFFTDFSQFIKDNYTLGDANLDNDVTVSDAVLTVSFVNETATPNERQQYTADANEDGDITVTDAVTIIDIALGIEDAEGVKGEFATPSSDYLVLDGQQISLVNQQAYRGFQMDITLEDGATFDGVELSARAKGYTVTATKRANGDIRIVAISLSRSVIESAEGLLMTVKTTGKIAAISNVEFTGTDKAAYELGVQVVTGINGINAELAGAQIYTVGGARTSKVQKGVNVVKMSNGSVKKVLVK